MKSKLAAAMNTLSEETRKDYINKYLQEDEKIDINTAIKEKYLYKK